jgi:hypothetical protein
MVMVTEMMPIHMMTAVVPVVMPSAIVPTIVPAEMNTERPVIAAVTEMQSRVMIPMIQWPSVIGIMVLISTPSTGPAVIILMAIVMIFLMPIDVDRQVEI